MSAFLSLENIYKTYPGQDGLVLADVNLTLAKGEIVALLGASGSGKTTLLKIVSGLESQDKGRVVLDGKILDGLPPEKRSTAMVFQKSLLFRHLTVAENINFAPRLNRAFERAELRARTSAMLELLHLEGYGRKRVTELSGGQEQRVSLGRALMTEPSLLLLDEPLSALDINLKWALLMEIRELNVRLGQTMLYVTHDQKEAAAVANRVAFLDGGRLARVARPHEFYSRPLSLAEAKFFGWENFIPCSLENGRLRSAMGEYALPGLALGAYRPGEGYYMCIRPEAAKNVGSGAWSGVVKSALPQGLGTLCEIECRGETLKLVLPARFVHHPGESVSFDLDPELFWVVPS
ncbi:MAG: ABC transporter ATP-binding protein [Gracilibacteraceae bacterium]|jgi:ABC-type Fe3+/spermidine/putrescine transport system ATPase subunit|nr:ABC transporter ATP-binding protein [Gracilibacteraceae bacterium]